MLLVLTKIVNQHNEINYHDYLWLMGVKMILERKGREIMVFVKKIG